LQKLEKKFLLCKKLRQGWIMARNRTRLEDLAKLAGVSTATISRALNDSPNVNQETKRRIWRLAQDNNYSFRPSMPAILSGAASKIVIVIPMTTSRDAKTSDPFFLELIGGVAEAARDVKCDIAISHLAPQSYEDLSDLVATNRADGIIFLGQSFLHDRFNRLAEEEGRFVVWGADLPGQKYCSVGSDNARGGQKATSHLIRLGRRRIAFLGDIEGPEIFQRYQGYLAALEAAKLTLDEGLVSPAHFELESAEAAVDAMFARRAEFDAIFAASDLIALGAIRAIRRAGKRVPQDISVVGYDNIKIARYNSPPLTTISQDMSKAGRLMVSKLLNSTHVGAAHSERLPTELIVRESCGL
jgi:DNA-binding LacI/PurR family transcriptional regulator